MVTKLKWPGYYAELLRILDDRCAQDKGMRRRNVYASRWRYRGEIHRNSSASRLCCLIQIFSIFIVRISTILNCDSFV